MKLDILTVSYHSKDLLDLNWNIFKSRNEGKFDYDWHISDNSNFADEHVEGFKYHDGVQHQVEPLRIDTIKIGCGSIHHGMGLNKGLQYLDDKADLWLIMDPDFYFLVSIKPILDYVLKEDYWFFGTEYANKKKKLIHDFPCMYCMFINPKYVKKEDLDCSPGYIGEKDKSEGWYPDVGFKTMYNFKKISGCKYGILPATDANLYMKGNQPIAFHSRAKINRMKKFLHGNDEPSNIDLKGRLKEIKYMAKCSENCKIEW